MQNNLSQLPGYKVNEYMLVLQPHEELHNKIVQVKKDFAQKFDAPAAEWGKPQILLTRFSQLQLMEERVLNRLRMIAMAMPAFKIELKDYGSYPTHTVFIKVDTQVPLQLLVKHIKTGQSLLKTKEHKPHFVNEFGINVCRNLLPWQYDKCWPEYSQKHFTGRFIARDLYLLKRREGEKNFKIIQRFEFMNMPVVTRQGALF